jgi:nicotinate-nucleotide adenylyltransferase
VRIGLLGGTFDPIHHAHLAVGIAARYHLKLDVVMFMVANVPWQKASTRNISSAEDRLAMVQLAVARRQGLVASDLELRRGGASYTADTLAELHQMHPGSELFLIVGSDLVDELTTWKRWEELPDQCTLAVAYRPGEDGALRLGAAPDWRHEQIRLPALELSSTELREMSSDGRPLDFLVPDTVMEYIQSHGLYRDRSWIDHPPSSPTDSPTDPPTDLPSS